jgi:hypothetical protein
MPFEKVEKRKRGGNPSITIHERGIYLSRSLRDRLGDPKYVDVFIDEDVRKLGIREGGDTSYNIANGNHIGPSVVCRKISEYQMLPIHLEGIYYPDEEMWVFDYA